MSYADMPLVNIQTGEPIPVLKSDKGSKVKSEAGRDPVGCAGVAVALVFLCCVIVLLLGSTAWLLMKMFT